MRILLKEGESVLADLSFGDEEITIGSQPGCTIHLPDLRISSRNAVIAPAEGGGWHIENLDPDNEVLLNGHGLMERVTLKNDDEVVLHEYLLKIYLESDLGRHVVEEPQLTTEQLARIREFPLPAGSVVKRHFDPASLGRQQLDRVSRVTLDIAGCRDIHQLVEVSLDLLLDVFNARVAWIGIRRQPEGELEIQGGRLSSGQPADSNPVIELLQYRCIERTQHICIRKVRDQEMIGSAMAVPLVATGGALGMIYVDRRRRTKRFQIPDLDLISVIASHVAAKLFALLQQRIQRTAAVSSTEASVVHLIQAQLDPKTSPSFDNLQLAAYSRSGQENPGDVYDVMQHPDAGITASMLGHVNATGASLALSMARLHSTFRVGFLHNDPPHALARALNWLMYDEQDPSTVDAVFLLVDPPSGKIKFSRAGKIGAFVVNASGEPRALPGTDAPAIGQIRNFEYVSHRGRLAPGETLAIYTRGAASCTNVEGERFGEHRFIEMLCDGFCQPPATTIQDLSYELTTFFADGKHPDDITIVLLHHVSK
ncbi:MAG TPA: SpoIIE family protein phosphatase [Phycisphaerae bacterium]|nr:SpoIIE family protein phosphatase [Phycisphaerae bacterium]